MLLITPPVLPSDMTHENFVDRLDALAIRQDAAVHTQEAAHLALILRCATHPLPIDEQGRTMQPQVPQLALAPAPRELSQEWWNGVFQRHDARRVAATRDAAIRAAEARSFAPDLHDDAVLHEIDDHADLHKIVSPERSTMNTSRKIPTM